ncbi:MAG: biopolymer transporter ExbD [Synechococcales bacterium]|nr:biopolymer transporter ExbD [Synechococcales bacterium]
MRLRSRQQESSLPPVNLIPMLNVMLGVLAFFVIITMTLGSQRGLEVQLPADADAPVQQPEEEEPPPPPLIVSLGSQGEILVDDQPVSAAQLEQRIQEYLGASEDGLVYLTASRQMPYQEVLAFLLDMKELGGDRVSLAIEESS